jgi:hypothetical protein
MIIVTYLMESAFCALFHTALNAMQILIKTLNVAIVKMDITKMKEDA